MTDLSEIKYPHLDRILHLYPGPQILLGEEIYWTEKKDGSNIGCFLNNDGVLQLRSRNQDKASDDFYAAFKRTKLQDNIIGLLQDASNWGDAYSIFGELCTKGRSPTRTELHEEDHFVVFDIYSFKRGKFITYTETHQQCYHFDIPVVELYGTSISKDLENLFEIKDEMLKIALEKGREGIVGKTWVENQWNAGENAGTKSGIMYFKEKHDTPKLEKIPRLNQDGSINLPVLPDTEVFGAIEKVRADIGDTDFKNVRVAMPLVAKYVQEECVKHCCQAPKGIHSYYQKRLADLVVP